MSYISVTREEKDAMLRATGASCIDDLFKDIPESIRLKGLPDLDGPLSEIEVEKKAGQAASGNMPLVPLLGAGSYLHHVPSVVDELCSRSEFYTAYTPYQPEVSQGTLTAIFEFQTMICELTGMEVANASMYDGATSLAESVLMAVRAKKRDRVIVSRAVHPHYRQVLRTYCDAGDIRYEEAAFENGTTQPGEIDRLMDETTGAVVTQSPNFFGLIEDTASLSAAAGRGGAYSIAVVTEAMSLGLLKPPGKCGADIVCGEAQSFGSYPGFGGPQLGFLAVRGDLMRKIPGRLVGRSVDTDGREAYVLTLQTREQHIRRERATSNICTNEGLMALRSVIYLGLLGPRLRELALLNHRLASRLRQGLIQAGMSPVWEGPFFNEFAVRCPDIEGFSARMKEMGYIPGLGLGQYYDEYSDCILFCATELLTPEEIDTLAAEAGRFFR